MIEISREEVRSRLKDPRLLLLNVLPRAAFEEARIPGSVNLPVAEIPSKARAILPDPLREIAVYCGGPT